MRKYLIYSLFLVFVGTAMTSCNRQACAAFDSEKSVEDNMKKKKGPKRPKSSLFGKGDFK